MERRRGLQTFLAHLAAYIVGNAFFGVWNALTYTVKDDDTLWFFLPLLFWGIGVIVHYWQGVVLFDTWWDRDEAEIRERMSGHSEPAPADAGEVAAEQES